MNLNLTAGLMRLPKEGADRDLLTKYLNFTIKNCLYDDKVEVYDRDKRKHVLAPNPNYYKDGDGITLSLPEYTASELKALWSILIKIGATDKQIDSLQRWVDTLKSPLSAKVEGIKAMERIFAQAIKTSPDRWVLLEMEDGSMCPFVCTSYKYNHGGRDDKPSFTMKFKSGLFFRGGDDDDDDKTSTISHNVYFYTKDIKDKRGFTEEDAAENIEDFFSSNPPSGEDDEDEDDAPKPPPKVVKKTTKRAKYEAPTMAELLAREGVYFFDDKTRADYFTQMTRFAQVATQIGTQYTVKGYGLEPQYSWSNDMSRLKRVRMEDEDQPYRVVIDMERLNLGTAPRTVNDDGVTVALPYSPIIKCYNITKHRRVAIHLDSLVPYQYNPALIDELIMERDQKDMLSGLIEGEMTFSDIVTGKSGGMIILSSGPAGTGKTLTAEVYSEVVKKPLYSVQSTELGLNVDDIEKNLSAVLHRTQRWNAVLLIDECDTYVYKRGQDMQQNAIVGTFLRLLEYFNGLMFLTTNRHDIVDTAILSRVTAHFRYEIPNTDIRKQIIQVLAKRMGVEVTDAAVGAIATKYNKMVGRDVRNLLKLVKKFHGKGGKTVKLTLDMLKPIAPFTPILNS